MIIIIITIIIIIKITVLIGGKKYNYFINNFSKINKMTEKYLNEKMLAKVLNFG